MPPLKICDVSEVMMGNFKFDFKDKVVVITGGARGIGKCITEQFSASGAIVCVIDLLENEYFVGIRYS